MSGNELYKQETGMRAKVKLEIQDGEGNILSQFDPYWMELGSQSLHELEGAVESSKGEHVAMSPSSKNCS